MAASKTVDICSVGDGTWIYSGVVSVWNEGAVDTINLAVNDCIQSKSGNGQYKDVLASCALISAPGQVIQAGTLQVNATTFDYAYQGPPIATGYIRNIARVTILNHSGNIGKAFGPEPKDTWTGGDPPACPTDCIGAACSIIPCGRDGALEPPNCRNQCVRSQGYWDTHDPWPSAVDPSALFYNSGIAWGVIGTLSPQGNGYLILANQYVASVINASTESLPTGVKDIIDQASAWFASVGTAEAACTSNSSCGLQKTWAEILAEYNTGAYLGPGQSPECPSVP